MMLEILSARCSQRAFSFDLTDAGNNESVIDLTDDGADDVIDLTNDEDDFEDERE